MPGAGRKVREEALRVRPASGSLLISDFNNVLGICIQKRLLFRALLLCPPSLSVSFSLSVSAICVLHVYSLAATIEMLSIKMRFKL